MKQMFHCEIYDVLHKCNIVALSLLSNMIYLCQCLFPISLITDHVLQIEESSYDLVFVAFWIAPFPAIENLTYFFALV